MKLICDKCGDDVGSGPLINDLCGPCHHETTGEGTVIDCVECRKRRYLDEEEFLVEAPLCRSCHFWAEYVALADDPRCVRIDGQHYWIVPDGQGPLGGLFQGSGGSAFTVEFFDGRRATSRNLWTQGQIPEHFRGRLPDNARFIERQIREERA
jgi:hypothetical protein